MRPGPQQNSRPPPEGATTSNASNTSSHRAPSTLPDDIRSATDPHAPSVDPENPPQLSSLHPGAPSPRFKSSHHARAARFLYNAANTGRLGSGPVEPNPKHLTFFLILFKTLPFFMLFVQLVWSCIVLAIAYVLRDRDAETSLSVNFWKSKFNVSPSVTYGVGWALFVLLGFFIREASERFREAQTSIQASASYITHLMRQIHMLYPQGSWHAGDHDRIAAHLVAFPIALKMTLRGERERQQLEHILHPDDISDVLAADVMHIHCTRVVRAYLVAMQDDSPACFKFSRARSTKAGLAVQFLVVDILDAVDLAANSAVRIAHFRPSVGYINHLRIFLYIWMFFLPLTLIRTSGWFTVLWSIFITYGVGMLFQIASALNEPYGHDLQDVKLNRLCSELAYDVLVDYSSVNMSMKDNVRADHETPEWLERPLEEDSHIEKSASILTRTGSFLKNIYKNLTASYAIFWSITAFAAWTAFIVFLTWGVSDHERDNGDRWWSVYLPLSKGTTSFVSLGVFLLLGFWMNDAYARYSRGLLLWQTTMRTNIQSLTLRVAIVCKRGFWHKRDRERLLSHLVALPYATKAHLRSSRDLSELESILDAHDLQALSEAPELPVHCAKVIFAYLNSAESVDEDILPEAKDPFLGTKFVFFYGLLNLEKSIVECLSMGKFRLSPSFTIHLRVYVFFLLVVFPISMVDFDGFLSFLFLLPIGYSIIKLLVIGSELSDPFGSDAHDIPLDGFCADIKKTIHDVYQESVDCVKPYIYEENYKREMFVPSVLEPPESSTHEEDSTTVEGTINLETVHLTKLAKPEIREEPQGNRVTIQGSLKKILSYFPSVSATAQLIATLWSVIAVFTSWGLSKLWNKENHGSCREWCSPIDVSTTELANIGFALFMVLAFRASDAINRYERGANLLLELERCLRDVAVDFSNIYPDNRWHQGDRERVIAHLIQVPLYLRDKLLAIDRSDATNKQGFLTDADYRRFQSNQDPFEYLLRTVESYLLIQNSAMRDELGLSQFKIKPFVYGNMTKHIGNIRDIYAEVMGVKTFPVVPSYANHQHLFTALWLTLLPLSMTSQTGFFTILWAPLVSYGVFGLEAIAIKLVDPYGHDSIDLPVYGILTDAANEILRAVESSDWDTKFHIHESPMEKKPQTDIVIRGDQAYEEHPFACFEKHIETAVNFNLGPPVHFDAGHEKKAKPTLYAHFLRSVPWWILAGITLWTTLACIISYVTRDAEAKDERWWKTSKSVNVSVATFVSFPAFTLLGFYVQAAFRRYNLAGSLWTNNLRESCHMLSVHMMHCIPDGMIHDGDKERILGHIAAIPLVLKHELRDSRDIREVKGLLSYEDVGRIQAAGSMVTHCVDVVRAYYMDAVGTRHAKEKPLGAAYCALSAPITDIAALGKVIHDCKFLKQIDIAPGFIILLNVLLGLWFLLLPFVLAEISGWFTIFWVPIVAYGLLGMYAVAAELQGPFGVDLNDLDLDEIADVIVEDILFIQKNYKSGLDVLVRPVSTGAKWSESDITSYTLRSSLYHDKEQSKFWEAVRLAMNAVRLWQMVGIVLWTTGSVFLAWGVSRWFKISPGACNSEWFCSYIAVDPSVKGFIGFALFLLLGFRLYDSHHRYVMALRIWQDGIIGTSRIFSTHLLESYTPGTWHKGDLERICGHIAAFSICTMGALRERSYEDKLAEVLGPEDVRRLLSVKDRMNYCIDVVRAYVLASDRMMGEKPKEHPAAGPEIFALFTYSKKLLEQGQECLSIVRVPLPFGYVQHLRIFLVIWLAMLPSGLVEATGWLTILWVLIIAYGILGINRWADELADPFGYDVSDVPLDELTDRVCGVLVNNFMLFRGDGVGNLIYTDRDGFGWSEDSY